MRRRIQTKGQILPVALIVGASLLVFALAMVNMLRSTTQMTQRVAKGNQALFASDLAVDKTINFLNSGAWGKPKEPFPFLTQYRGDYIHKDVQNTWYVVRVNPGNLVQPPGDQFYERTITVDAISFNAGMIPAATPEPTPWTINGHMPPNVANRRILQAVVKRGSIANALTSKGKIDVGGSASVFWGDVYSYGNVTNPMTDIVLDLQTQDVGPCYPEFHTETGCIKKQSGAGVCKNTFCNTDTLSLNCKMYPNDPNMPPEPIIDLPALKDLAKQVFVDPSTGINSRETGYFYYSAAMTAGPGANSLSGGAAGAGVEQNHQYNAANPISFDNKISTVLHRMRTNLGKSKTWVGDDTLVYYIDTTDGLELNTSTYANKAIGNGFGGSVDYKGGSKGTGANKTPDAAFQGFMILQGHFSQSGNGGVATALTSPGPEWCPASPRTEDICFNGFLYVGGNVIKYNGNPEVYGSIFVNGNFDGSGNITVWYRSDFNYGILARGSTAVTKWRQIKPMQFPANYYP